MEKYSSVVITELNFIRLQIYLPLTSARYNIFLLTLKVR
ncbi:MAG: hypothetical protein ACI9JP_003529 [Granulosicoccus sp.]|jgi:hypothetical protein